jgi:hypothetical protein
MAGSDRMPSPAVSFSVFVENDADAGTAAHAWPPRRNSDAPRRFDDALQAVSPGADLSSAVWEAANAIRGSDSPPFAPAEIARRLDLEILYAAQTSIVHGQMSAQAHLWTRDGCAKDCRQREARVLAH